MFQANRLFFWLTVYRFQLSYPFSDFGQPFNFFAIRLNGYGNRLNAWVNRLVSVENRFSWPFNEKALVSVFPKRVTIIEKTHVSVSV